MSRRRFVGQISATIVAMVLPSILPDKLANSLHESLISGFKGHDPKGTELFVVNSIVTSSQLGKRINLIATEVDSSYGEYTANLKRLVELGHLRQRTVERISESQISIVTVWASESHFHAYRNHKSTIALLGSMERHNVLLAEQVQTQAA